MTGSPSARRASELFVECLEAEGVDHIFGVPGEETLDLNESLSRSSIQFVPCRHEQGGGYIADVYGRLTGRAGVCLGTLGPGATNLVSAVADAFLDRAPLVALTGQGHLGGMHKESHQHIDVVSMMRPITKWNASLHEPESIPEMVRKAFKTAEAEKPGATHIELPDDVMAAAVSAAARPLTRQPPAPVEPPGRELARAAGIIAEARHPVILAGNGVVRGRAAPALREFSRATGIPVAETFMGKGLLPADSERALGAVGLQAGDYRMAGFDEADLVLAIGYDLVEHAPRHWNPARDKTIICIDTLPAEIDEYFVPDVELVGNIRGVLVHLGEHCAPVRGAGGSAGLHRAVRRHFAEAQHHDHFPMRPPRVLWELREALSADDILVSDVGLHKLWIGRMFPAFEPSTVIIANGFAGMGFAVPGAIAAKLVHPRHRVVAVTGDGGFMMNCQELETAVRLRTAFVTVIVEDGRYGSIAWKQEKRFGHHFGTDFGNPDFVRLAESFHIPGWRIGSAGELAGRLRHALTLDLPSLIVVPIDYSVDVAIVAELGMETVQT